MYFHIRNMEINVRTGVSGIRWSRVFGLIPVVLLTSLIFIPDRVVSDNDVFFLTDFASQDSTENFASPSRVKIDPIDRGYRNLVVAIKSDVNEEDFPTLLSEIQTAFTEASEYMYRATRALAYFKTIRILIPPTWQNTTAETATWERYDISDVRIAPADDNLPYTQKITGCGLQGDFISLTPDYVVNSNMGNNPLHFTYGTPKRVIVHEWGHFRWGLFDEYPRESRDAHFYQDTNTGKIEATRCVLAIPGEIRNRRTGALCGESDRDGDGLPNSDICAFFDDTEAETYSASIMYKQYLSNNEQFCDDPERDGVPDGVAHNPMAPNQQNDRCDHKSTWQVLRDHDDFANTSSLDPKPVDSTVPEFVIVRQKPQTTTVLVLDTSGSMEGERLVLLQQAATNIIENVLPLGSRLGIVRFHEYARVVHSIVEIDSVETRSQLVSSLPRTVDGRTSIGAGVRLAVEELEASEDNPAGSKLIVITDGEQNSLPFIDDVLDEVQGLIVSTVAVGSAADPQLEHLAEATGGQSYSHTDGSSEIYLSFFKAAAAQMTQSQVQDAVIDADFTSIPVRETFTSTFYLDDALTGGLKITIAYIWSLNPTDISVELIRPDGLVFGTNSDFFTTDARFKQIKIDLKGDNVVPGEWKLSVKNDGSFRDNFNIIIQPSISPGATPILVTAQWAVPQITPPQRQILYVFVNQGNTPVVNADVTAEIKLNAVNADKTVVILPRDDGIGADITKDDGIYSAYFTDFVGKGRHGVEVRVRANSETKYARGAVVGFGAAINPAAFLQGEESPETRVTYEVTGRFQREVTGGSFECTSETLCGNSSVDVYPPSRITDLTVTNVHPESKTLRLRFTAPGDDLADGTATRYEIHYSTNFTQINKEFNSTDIVPRDWFIVGNVTTPRRSGAAEKFVINVTLAVSEATNIIFGIQAIDDQENRSERSNLAISSFTLLAEPEFEPQKGKLSPGIIVGISLAALAVLLILIIIVIVLLYRRSRAPSKTQCPQCNGKPEIKV